MGTFVDTFYHENTRKKEYLTIFNIASPEIKAHSVKLVIQDDYLCVSFYRKDNFLAEFSFRQFYGNPYVLFSNRTLVAEKYRNKGIAQAMQKVKEQVCRDNNITLLLATVVMGNSAQEHVLNKCGWKLLTHFDDGGLYGVREKGYLLFGLNIEKEN